jgi:hypothetical protein
MADPNYLAMKAAKRAKREAGREACARGEHTKQLTWLHWKRQAIRATSPATEMLIASGIVGAANCISINNKPLRAPLGTYNGFCMRCGEALQWASDRRAIAFSASEP